MSNSNVKRQVKTLRGVYDVIEWDGNDTSGFKPLGDRVLVLPDQPAELSKGGIILGSEEEREKVALAAESGVLIACGPDAFKWGARNQKIETPPPAPGTRVFFKRYVGEMYPSRDGRFYFIMSDISIGGMEVA